MKQRGTLVATAVSIIMGLTGAGAQSRYEAPAVLSAADVAPAELLHS